MKFLMIFFKLGANVIKNGCKTSIINQSIRSGIVPNSMKQARVKPFFKKGSPLQVGNYRPVSILSIVSKILEKSIYCQLKEFLQINHMLYEFQSGFRSKFSTDTCLIHLLDQITAWDNNSKGLFTGMIMLDLQKAFDTVDHEMLCSELDIMGIDSLWSKSYLKLTCRHINHRHICFNIKSISVHPLLWMNVMLDFICMVFAGM